MPSMEQIKIEHPDTWVAVEVTRVENGEVVEGTLLLEDGDRKAIWEEVELPRTDEKREVFIFFTGEPLEKGHAAAF